MIPIKLLLASLILSAIYYIYISLNTSFSFRNLITFSTSLFLPGSIFILLRILYFFLVSFHLGHFSRQYMIVSVWFPHAVSDGNLFKWFGHFFLFSMFPWVTYHVAISRYFCMVVCKKFHNLVRLGNLFSFIFPVRIPFQF